MKEGPNQYIECVSIMEIFGIKKDTHKWNIKDCDFVAGGTSEITHSAEQVLLISSAHCNCN